MRPIRPIIVTAVIVFAGATAAAGATHVPRFLSGDPLQLQAGTRLSPGPWKRLSHATSRKPRAAAFTRGFIETPRALAFTVTAPRPGTVRLFWSVYCEGVENDAIFNQQGTVTMRTPFSGYAPVMLDATKCFLTLRATPISPTKAMATVYGY
jgi:hypothetical protein